MRFTSAFKELDPIPQCKATAKLGEFLEERFSMVLGVRQCRPCVEGSLRLAVVCGHPSKPNFLSHSSD
jgi:hypothetical protein